MNGPKFQCPFHEMSNKIFLFCEMSNFTTTSICLCRIDPGTGVITMLEGAPRGQHVLKVSVLDSTQSRTVESTVNVNIVYIEQDAVMSSGSMRLQGVYNSAVLVHLNLFPIFLSTLDYFEHM